MTASIRLFSASSFFTSVFFVLLSFFLSFFLSFSFFIFYNFIIFRLRLRPNSLNSVLLNLSCVWIFLITDFILIVIAMALIMLLSFIISLGGLGWGEVGGKSL